MTLPYRNHMRLSPASGATFHYIHGEREFRLGRRRLARGAAALVFASPFDRVGSSSSRSQVSSLLHEGA